jgi:hypothetical protein
MDLEFYAGRSRMEGGTPDMVIIPNGADAQANVGIGTTSPTSALDVTGTVTSDGLDVSPSSGDASLTLTSNSSQPWKIYSPNASNALHFNSDSTDYLSIDTTGSVGIGTSSPSTLMHLSSTSPALTIEDSDATSTFNKFEIGNSSGSINFNTRQSNGTFVSTDYQMSKNATGTIAHKWFISGSERARIDGSGNLLVGTTTVSLYNSSSEVGTRIGDGVLMVNRSANTPAYFNRLSTDGTIVDFRKDGSTVGSIGVDYNDNLFLSGKSDHAGIMFANDEVYPYRDGNYRDATLDLGATSGRWRNLYLSGGHMNGQANSLSFISGGNASNGGANILLYGQSHSSLANTTLFRASGSEAMRIDSSQNVMIGGTNARPAEFAHPKGISFRGDIGQIQASTDANTAMLLNRDTSDGTIAEFRKDGTSVGSIASTFGIDIHIGTGDTRLRFVDQNDYIRPANSDGSSRDGLTDLGASTARFDDIYATNGTIQTSDINEKQDIEDLTDAETRVAVAAKGLLKKYRWKSAVEEKGDDARIHFGIMAQDLQNAFTAEGLDAGDYGMFISTTWTNDDGVEQTRLGVRYNELLAFIIAVI